MLLLDQVMLSTGALCAILFGGVGGSVLLIWLCGFERTMLCVEDLCLVAIEVDAESQASS